MQNLGTRLHAGGLKHFRALLQSARLQTAEQSSALAIFESCTISGRQTLTEMPHLLALRPVAR